MISFLANRELAQVCKWLGSGLDIGNELEILTVLDKIVNEKTI